MLRASFSFRTTAAVASSPLLRRSVMGAMINRPMGGEAGQVTSHAPSPSDSATTTDSAQLPSPKISDTAAVQLKDVFVGFKKADGVLEFHRHPVPEAKLDSMSVRQMVNAALRRLVKAEIPEARVLSEVEFKVTSIAVDKADGGAETLAVAHKGDGDRVNLKAKLSDLQPLDAAKPWVHLYVQPKSGAQASKAGPIALQGGSSAAVTTSPMVATAATSTNDNAAGVAAKNISHFPNAESFRTEANPIVAQVTETYFVKEDNGGTYTVVTSDATEAEKQRSAAVLALPEGLEWPAQLFNKLFKRDFYDRFIENELMSFYNPFGRSRVAVTGTPGIGLSSFAVYVAWYALKMGRTVVYQHFTSPDRYNVLTPGCKFLSVYERGDVPPELKDPNVIYVVDNTTPQYSAKAFTLCVTTPDGECIHRWRKTGVCQYYFPTWTLDEMKLMRTHCYDNKSFSFSGKHVELPDDVLQERFNKVGGIPRFVFIEANYMSHRTQDLAPIGVNRDTFKMV